MSLSNSFDAFMARFLVPEHAGAERTCPVSYGIITYIYAHDNAF